MKKAVSVLLSLVMLITAVSGVTVEAYAAAKPKATSISSVTAKSGAFTVKWKKVKSVTGYQVQYSTSSKFKKNNKTVKVSKSSKTSKTISKLKAKKKYYVRVRTYKKGKKKTTYSTWSKSKSVTTKAQTTKETTTKKVYKDPEYGYCMYDWPEPSDYSKDRWRGVIITYTWYENEKEWGTSYIFGSSTSNSDRNEIKKYATDFFPCPNREGKYDGEQIKSDNIWVWLG